MKRPLTRFTLFRPFKVFNPLQSFIGGFFAKASGGAETLIEQDGKYYRVHTFTTVGTSTLTVTRGGLFEYLVVAGGGGGGDVQGFLSTPGGGGGAGGMLFGSVTAISQAYNVVVGSGGARVTNNNGANGGNSSAFGFTVIGGGGGGGLLAAGQGRPGSAGGSGGGGCVNGAGGAGTSGQGNAGGNGAGVSVLSAGGGGRGGAGVNGGAAGGAGGAGLANSITGASITYAAGGNTGPITLGFIGADGAANTGNGGQGGGPGTEGLAGLGGSGIVIVRYRISKAEYDSVASFTYDTATTDPGATIPRAVPAFVERELYDKMRGCVLNPDRTVNYYLDPDDWTKKADGTPSDLTGADGNVMIEIPKFYFRVVRIGTEVTWQITPKNLPGFAVHPGFILDGDEVDHRYYSAYDACLLRVARPITGATVADPVVITSTNHGLQTGNKATITGVGGMTEINDRTFTVTRIDDNTFSLDGEDGTGHTAYDTGGTWTGHASGGNRDDNTAFTSTGTDKLASVKGVHPWVGLTRAEFRAVAANVGAKWRQLDFPLRDAIGMLYVVEYQTFDSQAELGNGNTNNTYPTTATDPTQAGSPHTIAGFRDDVGNGSTTPANGQGTATRPGTVAMKYRGIENLFGNCWDWADGINVNVTATGNVHIANDNDRANYADNVPTNHTLITSSLTTTSANIQTLLPLDAFFLAATTGGTSSQYITDRHFGSATSNRVVRVGRAANDGADAGVFALGASSAASDRSRGIGARLAV